MLLNASFHFQAFIFWVVDNFLKKKKWKTAHTSVNSNESAVKYFKAIGKVKYYNPAGQGDDSESDTLLSFDDESDHKFAAQNNGHLPEQHRLLSPQTT